MTSISSSFTENNKIIEYFEVVGRGENIRHSDGAIVVDAGWNTEPTLNCAVLMRISSKLKNVRIQAEFRGYVETRWEGLQTLAKQPEGPDYKINVTGRIFQQLVQIVYQSKDAIKPQKSGGTLLYPFSFVLPKNNMPPTFETIQGSIMYYIKCSILFQEPLKLLKTNYDIEVPVIVGMPDSAKLILLRSPTQMSHSFDGSSEQIGCTITLPRRVVTLGDAVEVNVVIHWTPPGTTLRSMMVSLRPVVSYLSNVQHLTQARGAVAPVPRPLSEVVETFPLLVVDGREGSETILRQLYLDVDPTLAMASFESSLISCRTVLRIQMILDNSETPNISYEVPIVVLPNPKDSSYTMPPELRILHKSRSQHVYMNRHHNNLRDSGKVFTPPKRSDSLSSNTRSLAASVETQHYPLLHRSFTNGTPRQRTSSNTFADQHFQFHHYSPIISESYIT
ncbi:hypothetical protein HK100_001828 [Physocladia obscura]|uniref:Arrestin-like N-terminal domain-containing protein n=1 Tax=Physocladia obscura TaxID=109957 RepID=A0AAD5SXE3_9FUNG|nr:hypothetical protein HK100_001828 [Physocladia obscura]